MHAPNSMLAVEFASATTLTHRRRCLLHGPPEARRIERRIAIEIRLDLIEVREQPRSGDETAPNHLAHVRDVLAMPTFQFGQRPIVDDRHPINTAVVPPTK